MTRQHAPSVYNAVRTAVKRLIGALGGLDATAACVRVGRSQLSQYGDVNSDRHIPVDVVLDAEALAGEPFVTAALAYAQGYRLTPIDPQKSGDVRLAALRVGRDVSQLFVDMTAALADDHLNDVERGVLATDLDAVIRVATQMRQLVVGTGDQARAPSDE